MLVESSVFPVDSVPVSNCGRQLHYKSGGMHAIVLASNS